VAGVAADSSVLTSNRPYDSRRGAATARSITKHQELVVRRRLLRWGRRNFKKFPWRFETDPWWSFLAELLLQRTRATQVSRLFDDMRFRFPTAASLVHAGISVVQDWTGTIGLHRRVPLILSIAAAIADRGGSPPESLGELRQLVGVGPYTAAAWLSLHREKRAAIVDCNVARWLSRLTGMPVCKDPRNVRWVNDLADRLTPRRAFRDYNYAVLDFTMAICKPRHPKCVECPLKSECHHALDRV
jgi:A/G-specific adenine glycosylase